MIDRLRVWSLRAQSEADNADNTTDMLSWTGQAQVLSSVAEFLASQGTQLGPGAARLQIISGRQKSIGAWDLARGNPRDLAVHAGEVAGYDLALSLLQDVGATWAA
jgi:hypothetical protein